MLSEANFYLETCHRMSRQWQPERGFKLSLGQLSTIRHISLTLDRLYSNVGALRQLITTSLPNLRRVTSHIPRTEYSLFGVGSFVQTDPDGTMSASHLQNLKKNVESDLHYCLSKHPWSGSDVKRTDTHEVLAAWQDCGRRFEPIIVAWTYAHGPFPTEQAEAGLDWYNAVRIVLEINLKTRVVIAKKVNDSSDMNQLHHPACRPEHRFVLGEAVIENMVESVDSQDIS
ncbi:uncharacterized protein AB675_7279 [Cyphellophora attinorum]|uniref:Uncharacterized protein n=1 Tax=Cyphellophora attinorum TaxID=1664694 RepID=A0A0N1GZ57_9EURO|nr:uncharacterized protein AB675_7279 [Phialophora attinorum]KPI36322.1 hypothetical protein AB675_7279 [Phialophora attinorum]